MAEKFGSKTYRHRFSIVFILATLLFGNILYSVRAEQFSPPTLRETLRTIEPSVVWILAKIDTDKWAQGTGFIIHEDGYIVTNAHVVESATSVMVGWPDRYDRDECIAEIIASDKELDLAILKIDGAHFPVVPIDTSKSAHVGDSVIMLGFPAGEDLGLSNVTVTRGIISTIRNSSSQKTGMIQTDATLTLGCSGGPLYDLDTGTVVGVVQGKGMFLLEGFNFAIPIERVFSLSDSLTENKIDSLVASLDKNAGSGYSSPKVRSLESYKLGRIAMNENAWSEAVSHFNCAMKLYDEDPVVAYALAESYGALNQKSQALRWLERAFELGYSDFDGALKSECLDKLGNDPEFRRLVDSF